MLYSTLSRFQGAIWGSLYPTGAKSQVLAELLIRQSKYLIQSSDVQNQQIADLDKLTTSQIALVSLPVILFFHESPQLLTSKLTTILEKLDQSTTILQELLIWGKAISLALTEKLHPETLIPQLLAENNPSQLSEQLQQVQTYLEQNLSLTQVVKRLSRYKQASTAIALAIYCFLFTPEDFALAMLRAKQSDYQREITLALTGALAGAYNSYNSIPLHWRLSSQHNQQQRVSNLIASQLYAAWCGVTPIAMANWQFNSPTIATPGLIQPRQQLKIISQQQTWSDL